MTTAGRPLQGLCKMLPDLAEVQNSQCHEFLMVGIKPDINKEGIQEGAVIFDLAKQVRSGHACVCF